MHRPFVLMQALISQYAVPILEDQSVFGTDDQTRTAYLDTQDVARMTMAALRTDATIGKTITLAGPKAYTTSEVRVRERVEVRQLAGGVNTSPPPQECSRANVDTLTAEQGRRQPCT
jgi:hypothetical protein